MLVKLAMNFLQQTFYSNSVEKYYTLFFYKKIFIKKWASKPQKHENVKKISSLKWLSRNF